MSRAMASINEKAETELDKIRYDFKESMRLAKEIFGVEAFRKVYNDTKINPPINKAIFDAISVQFALLTDSERRALKVKKIEFKEMMKHALSSDGKFFIAVTSSTGDRNRVIYRHSAVKQIINNALFI